MASDRKEVITDIGIREFARVDRELRAELL